MSRTLLVTGGAGFIGSALVRKLIAETGYTVVNVDKLTYAGNLESLTSVADNERYHFEKVDICDGERVRALFEKYSPDGVLHLAAESHVDRSIDAPSARSSAETIVGDGSTNTSARIASGSSPSLVSTMSYVPPVEIHTYTSPATTSCSSSLASSTPAMSLQATDDFADGLSCCGLVFGISFSVRQKKKTMANMNSSVATPDHSSAKSLSAWANASVISTSIGSASNPWSLPGRIVPRGYPQTARAAWAKNAVAHSTSRTSMRSSAACHRPMAS